MEMSIVSFMLTNTIPQPEYTNLNHTNVLQCFNCCHYEYNGRTQNSFAEFDLKICSDCISWYVDNLFTIEIKKIVLDQNQNLFLFQEEPYKNMAEDSRDNVSMDESESNSELASVGGVTKHCLTNQLQYIQKNVIKSMMTHKCAGPFLKPVNVKVYNVSICSLLFSFM